MNKLIALAFVASAVTAFAEDNIFGCFTLNSSAEEVILGVPWVAPGSANDSIKVTDVIKTDNLVVGDQLYYYANGYKMWQIKQTEDGAKVWEGATIVEGSKINPSKGGEETLKRGNALILKRFNLNDRGDKTIVIYGQVASSGSAKINIVAGTDAAPAYTLLAPPAVAAVPLNSGTWDGCGDKDVIIIAGQNDFKYNGEKWGHKSPGFNENGDIVVAWKDMEVTIPDGQGAWYVSRSGKVATWELNDLPSTGTVK